MKGGLTPIEGCLHCGLPKRDHAQRWRSGVGWHTWAEPSPEQRGARAELIRELRFQAREGK